MIRRFVCILIPFILLLSACGGGDGETAAVAEAPATNTPEPTETPLPPTETSKAEDEVSLFSMDEESKDDTTSNEAKVEPSASPTPTVAPPTSTPKPSNTPEATATLAPTATPPMPGMGWDIPEAIRDEMILIPAGPFLFGSNEGNIESSPAQTIDLPAFEMDTYEVTNADFAVFVANSGYASYAEQQGGQSWLNYALNRPDHPVVKVTWDDALAFCEWAGKRLPTEMEWEKAARGENGQAYPWGNSFDGGLANVKETGLRDTVPTGTYPNGVSPYGVHDLGGNVWEWTSSWYLPYPNSTTENQYFGERFRVTRGGAWFEEPAQVTTFNRNAADPLITANNDLGFRCAR